MIDTVKAGTGEPPKPGNGQEARRVRTRERLIETASRLFSQTHPAGVTIDDITQAANLAKGTFYNHFTDKDALAQEVRRRVMARSDEAVTALNAGVDDAAVRVARGLCHYARLVSSDPVQAGLMVRHVPLELTSDSVAVTGASADIALGIATGRLRAATRESGAIFVIGAGTVLMQRLLADGAPAFAMLLTQQMVSMTLKGLGVAPDEAERIAAQCCEDILAGGLGLSST